MNLMEIWTQTTTNGLKTNVKIINFDHSLDNYS